MVTLGLGGVSRIFLWHDSGPFIGSQVTFLDVCGLQFDSSRDSDVVDKFKKFFDLIVVQRRMNACC
jgi:hypothetical protein